MRVDCPRTRAQIIIMARLIDKSFFLELAQEGSEVINCPASYCQRVMYVQDIFIHVAVQDLQVYKQYFLFEIMHGYIYNNVPPII